MRIGLAAIGIGNGARPDVLRESAIAAERAGFATLWVGEHVVLVEGQRSTYPYAESGAFPIAGDVDWLDPFAGLAFAAAVTSRIRLATGICLVPEHNPLVLAKQTASLDRLSSGRFALGAGVGWMAEEFAALGIPFERRAQRTREYVEILRRLWRDEVASFDGEFARFSGVRCHPKPLAGRIPVIFGGESDAALGRAASIGDGWYGFNLNPAEAAERITALRARLAKRGRAVSEVEVIVAPYSKRIDVDDIARYRDLGVDELVIVGNPPAEAAAVPTWIERLAKRWLG